MPDLSENPTAREVLIALNAHVQSCGLYQKINLTFMGAVLAVLVAFAGYTYTQNQGFQQRQIAAIQSSETGLSQSRAVAEAVGAPIVPKKAVSPQ